MSDPRVDELELRYTEQQHLIEELSQVLYRQQRELDALTKELEQVKKKVGEFDPGLVDAARDEKPPHY